MISVILASNEDNEADLLKVWGDVMVYMIDTKRTVFVMLLARRAICVGHRVGFVSEATK